MKKRITALFLCICLLVASISMLSANAAETDESAIPFDSIATVDGNMVTVSIISNREFAYTTFKLEYINLPAGIACKITNGSDAGDYINDTYIDDWGDEVECSGSITSNNKDTDNNPVCIMTVMAPQMLDNDKVVASGKTLATVKFNMANVADGWKVSDLVLKAQLASSIDKSHFAWEGKTTVTKTEGGEEEIPVSSVGFDKSTLAFDCTDIANSTGKDLTLSVLPENATQDKAVTFSVTSGDDVISITPNDTNTKVTVKALKIGEATVTATLTANPEITGTCKVTVSHKSISSVAAITADCTTGARDAYNKCSGCGNCYAATDTTGTGAVIEEPTQGQPLGHDYKATFTWSKNTDDTWSATAKLVCQNNKNHVLTEDDGVDCEENYVDDPASTCTKAGSRTYTATAKLDNKAVACTDGTDTKTVELGLAAHVKDQEFAREESTCTKHGHIKYYTCKNCNKKFIDEACTTEVTDISLDLAAHEYEWVEKSPADCTNAQILEEVCKNCKHPSGNTQEGQAAKGHDWSGFTVTQEPDPAHNIQGKKERTCSKCLAVDVVYFDHECKGNLSPVEAVTANCETKTDGVEAHYECTYNGCGKLYRDADGEELVTIEEITTPWTTAHTLQGEGKVDEGCLTTGKKAYWHCTKCGMLFEDSEGKIETTEANLVIAAHTTELDYYSSIE